MGGAMRNAELIAAARTDVPALAATVLKLCAEVERLRRGLERIASSACENECDAEAEETLYPEGWPTCPTCGRDCICGEEE